MKIAAVSNDAYTEERVFQFSASISRYPIFDGNKNFLTQRGHMEVDLADLVPSKSVKIIDSSIRRDFQ